MASKDWIPTTFEKPLAGAVDLSKRQPQQQGPGKIDMQINVTYALTSCTDVNEWFPAFGMMRDDGQSAPFLMFTTEDGVARVYVLHETAENLLRSFIEAIDNDRAEKLAAAEAAAAAETEEKVEPDAEPQ